MENFARLAALPLFGGISDLTAVLEKTGARVQRYEKGAFLLRRGETAERMGVVLSGGVHIVREDFWGNRSLLASLAAGDIFAEAYAMPGSGAMRSDVVAVESCTVLLMDVERVLSRCTNSCAFHARLTGNLFALLAEKNRILARKVDYLAQRTTRQRLLTYLSEQAQRAGSAEFTIPFNRQQLADFLSVERSAMSAELSRMQAEGLLEMERSHFRLK